MHINGLNEGGEKMRFLRSNLLTQILIAFIIAIGLGIVFG